MKYQKIFFRDIHPSFDDDSLFLRVYISSDNVNVTKRPFILILPGGGYEYCSESEAEPAACRFLAEGFNCAILNYSCYEKYPLPHLEVALAIKFIREHEIDFRIAKNFVALMGFSAGGHLAGSYPYLCEELADLLKIDNIGLTPDALVLSYPVLSMKEDTHQTTKEIITDNECELIEKLNVIDHVDNKYPPTFIWTTEEDLDVPPSNTKNMIKALKKENIQFESKIFDKGFHGTSIYTRGCRKKEEMFDNMEPIKEWPTLASNFLFKIFDKNN